MQVTKENSQMKKNLIVLSLASAMAVTGCQSTGESYEASTYKADQVNQKQEAKTIKIIAVTPAKIEIDNTESKETAETAGLILGALGGALLGQASNNSAAGGILGGVAGAGAGSLVSDKKLVDGVTLTYSEDNKIFTSTQVGKSCEFAPGVALVIMTKANETRVQPNAVCPKEE